MLLLLCLGRMTAPHTADTPGSTDLCENPAKGHHWMIKRRLTDSAGFAALEETVHGWEMNNTPLHFYQWTSCSSFSQMCSLICKPQFNLLFHEKFLYKEIGQERDQACKLHSETADGSQPQHDFVNWFQSSLNYQWVSSKQGRFTVTSASFHSKNDTVIWMLWRLKHSSDGASLFIKSRASSIFLTNIIQTYTKLILLNHHLWTC